MIINNRNIFIAVIVLLVVGVLIYFWSGKEENRQIIGGDRDQYGCLTAAGYSFDTEVEACIRTFEMTPDIKKAAKIAVAEPPKTIMKFTIFSGSISIFRPP